MFATEAHVEVEATWGVYQRIVAAYRDPNRTTAKTELAKIITAIGGAVPATLTELITLGRTLKRRAADVLAYFDRPGTSNGATHRWLHSASRLLLATGRKRPLDRYRTTQTYPARTTQELRPTALDRRQVS